MPTPGLCSITFRNLSPHEIIAACVDSGLKAIEWGGDVHCPHGKTAVAKLLRKACEDVGIATPSYGSYFRMNPECSDPDFRHVLDSALALGAKTIRVWAGDKPSEEMDADYRARLVDEIRLIAAMAESAGCSIGLEYHRFTATDSNASALQLLKQVDHAAVKTYWQPREETSVEQRIDGLQMILPKLCHLHVFHWIGSPVVRRPLAEATEEWRRYVQVVEAAGIEDPCAFLEFVRDDSLDSLKEDASCLLQILGGSM
jgi:3-dehydroshikimate dehydratase